MRTTTPVAAPLALAALLLALAACGGSSGEASTPASPDVSTTTAPPTTESAAASPVAPASALADLARRGASTAFTGTYALDSTDPKRPDGTVTIARLDTSYRVEITSGSSRAVLLTTAKGLVSCQLAEKKVCLLVAAPGKEPPPAFDPGVQRLVTSDLTALGSAGGLTVQESGMLPASADLAEAQCYRVSGSGVDRGEYCLTQDGVLRKATFPSGTLTLTKLGAAPTRASFRPPVSPTPLPR